MRIGLISDIHGNIAALDAVLAELESESIDQIVCLGDVAVGPRPSETVARLRGLDCPVIMGNWDQWFLEGIPEIGGEVGPKLVEQGEWWAKQLSQSDRDFLGSFQQVFELPLEDGGRALCFHGSPRSSEEGIEAVTPHEQIDAYLDGETAEVYLCGHTHLQLLRCHHASLIANPGSVGLPFRAPVPPGAVPVSPWAEYGIFTSSAERLAFEGRRTRYDVQSVLDDVLESGIPHARWWVDCWQV